MKKMLWTNGMWSDDRTKRSRFMAVYITILSIIVAAIVGGSATAFKVAIACVLITAVVFAISAITSPSHTGQHRQAGQD